MTLSWLLMSGLLDDSPILRKVATALADSEFDYIPYGYFNDPVNQWARQESRRDGLRARARAVVIFDRALNVRDEVAA